MRLVTALLAALGLAVYCVYESRLGPTPQPGCTVTAGRRSLELEPAQAANASTIAAVADSRNLPERALTIALATAMQESALRNIGHGDRDSLGLFQQRPSQGWGTAAQTMDPVHAANAFFDRLVKIRDYARLPLTVAAQRVQRSGFPEAYAKHEADAALLSSALTGRDSAALTCVTGGGSNGTLVGGDPAAIRTRLVREFGRRVRPVAAAPGQAAPGPRREAGGGPAGDGGGNPAGNAGGSPAANADGGPVGGEDGGMGGGSGGTAGSAASGAPDGGTVRTLWVAPAATGDTTRQGWALAQWAVAHAQQLKIWEVAYRGRVWCSQSSAEGWRKATPDGSRAPGGEVRISVVNVAGAAGAANAAGSSNSADDHP